MQLNKAYDEFKALGAEVLAIHVECSPEGTQSTVRRSRIEFPMASDEHLRVVGKYSPTSTYLIDKEGIIRALWHDRIHERVSPDEILGSIKRLAETR